MGAPYPVLNNGLATDQGIWDVATAARVRVGTRATLDDGRTFFYARSSGAAIVAGNNLSAEIQTAQFTELAVPTSLAGATSVSVTLGSTAVTINEYAGGYLCVIDDTGEGITYKIDGHAAADASGPVVIELVDAINVDFGAGTTVQLVKNPWMDVVIAAAAQAHFSVGISQVAVGSGATTSQYFWVQTAGISCAWQDLATGPGVHMVSGSTSGQFGDTAAGGDQFLAVNLWTVSTAGENNPVWLTIAD